MLHTNPSLGRCIISLTQPSIERVSTDQLWLSVVHFVCSANEHTLCCDHRGDQPQWHDRFDPGREYHVRRLEGTGVYSAVYSAVYLAVYLAVYSALPLSLACITTPRTLARARYSICKPGEGGNGESFGKKRAYRTESLADVAQRQAASRATIVAVWSV